MTPRSQRQVTWLVAASVVCGLVYLRAWRASRPGAADVSPPEAGAAATLPLPESSQRQTQRRTAQQHRMSELSWGRDPFTLAPRDGVGGLVLSGIMWDAAHPIAMIGDQAVGVGDAIGSMRVLEIRPDAVRLSDGSREYELHISP